MGSELLVRARDLSKAYPRRGNPLLRMAGLVAGGAFASGAPVLRGVDLDLRRGDALAVIGRNGAGKSTLLQLLCGVQMPTRGTVERFGRVAAMLELGAGFNPQFTGRENVEMSASAHGLGDSEIVARLPSIEAFAEIGAFFDRPVEEYSSGMRARLAFAVCAHVDADILVVDEVLGVGDAAFQAKCRAFIERFLAGGALVFVSHDEHALVSVCRDAIWLENGSVAGTGSVDAVLRRYHARDVEANGRSVASHADEPDEDFDGPENQVELSPFDPAAAAHGHGGVVIDDVAFLDAAGARVDRIEGGRRVVLSIGGRALGPVHRPIVGFILRNAAGQNILGDNTFHAFRDDPRPFSAGDRFRARFDFRLPLLPVGTYSLAPSVIDGTQQHHVQLFWMEEAMILTVHASPVRLGAVGVPMRVIVRPGPA